MSISTHGRVTGKVETVLFTIIDQHVRGCIINGEPWFSVTDILTLIQVKNTAAAVIKGIHYKYTDLCRLTTLSGNKHAGKDNVHNIVNLPGMVKIVARSKTEKAAEVYEYLFEFEYVIQGSNFVRNSIPMDNYLKERNYI